VYFTPARPLNSSVIVERILVEKSKRRLHVISNGTIVKTYKISLGRNPLGDKQFEGDRKTPEGLYYINDKNPHSQYHKNMGISYPNRQDREEARILGKKPGGQIKIHGLKNGRGWIGKLHLLKDWTFGCIALSNSEMDELYAAVKVGTPIEIKP
jgi:murein L,D-transpeptidase YafK